MSVSMMAWAAALVQHEERPVAVLLGVEEVAVEGDAVLTQQRGNGREAEDGVE